MSVWSTVCELPQVRMVEAYEEGGQLGGGDGTHFGI
jgi:hypothetical protein